MCMEINLTANEWEIMKIIWAQQPCTLRMICDEVGKTHSWTRHAVISFLKRMESKGAIHVEEAEPVKIYTAAIEQETAIRQELGSTLARVFDDSPIMMVSYLAKSNSFTEQEIEQMIAILKDGDEPDDK